MILSNLSDVFRSTSFLKYALALIKVDGVGVVNARKILFKYNDLSEIFNSKSACAFECEGVSEMIFDRIRKFKDFDLIEKEIAFLKEANVNVLSVLDEAYPYNLKQCHDAPFLLFTKGVVDFNNTKVLSIVGTRNVTSYGSDFVKELIQELKKYNPIIVSGYAYGVDICAHLAAIDNGLQTIAVLGQSLEVTYPKVHAKYNKRVMENGGFVTEFSINDPLIKENFIRRNRIVAGLSQATIVIESAVKGGSLSTAKFANDYNRDVFALPGRISDLFSMGCNNLIKTNQANLLTSVDDLIYYLNWDQELRNDKSSKVFEIPNDLSREEMIVVLFLRENGSEILDVIAFKTEMPVYKLIVILLNLELRNLVVPLPGKLFELKK